MSRQQVVQLVIPATLIMLFLVACGGNTPAPVLEVLTPTSVLEVPTATPTSVPATEEPTITAVATASGPRVGDAAPDFTLADINGNMVHLADELKDHKIVVLVFYYAHT